MSKSITMGKVFWIIGITLAAIVLLLATGCKKEVITGDIVYPITHWPAVKALDVTHKTDSSATLNGTVNTYGLPTIVTFEYGSTTNYDSTVTAYQIPVSGDSIIDVRANISGLTLCMPYHFRVRAENSLWTNFYSSDKTFTVGQAPDAHTAVATNITPIGATLNGTVNACGLPATVTFEYGPTTSYGNTLAANPGTVRGGVTTSVSADITGLAAGTTYHFRVRAEKSCGTAYGSDVEFRLNATVTDIEGNVYKTVDIGNQTWMAENLRTTHYADGSTIPLVTGNDNWAALTYADKAYCWFNNDSVSNAKTYGALYTWSAAMNGAVSSSSNPSGIQGVCPVGWHLPSDQEWTTLTDYLGGLDVAGAKLKETGTSHWRSPNAVATNESGFTALPGGHRSYDAVWWDFNDLGFWWSSTEEDYNRRWYRVIVSTETTAEMYRRSSKDQDGFSVRCVYGGEYKAVMTSAATNISKDGITLNGYVLANNLPSIVTFEYGTSTSYGQTVTAIQSPIDGNRSTNVSAQLTGLTCGVIYHFRIKVENSQGVVYGDDLTFDTKKIPTLTTTSVTDITATTAISGGIITDEGCEPITDRGVGLFKIQYRTIILLYKTHDGTGTGSFTSTLTRLQPSTRYCVRAYATNSSGTAYANQIFFTTPAIGK